MEREYAQTLHLGVHQEMRWREPQWEGMGCREV